MDEVLKLLSVMTGDSSYEKILAGKGKHEEVHSMCDVAERLKNAGWAEGWTKGLKEGKEEGLKEGKEEGLKEGLKEGQLLLVDTVNRLNAGESGSILINHIILEF